MSLCPKCEIPMDMGTWNLTKYYVCGNFDCDYVDEKDPTHPDYHKPTPLGRALGELIGGKVIGIDTDNTMLAIKVHGILYYLNIESAMMAPWFSVGRKNEVGRIDWIERDTKDEVLLADWGIANPVLDLEEGES